MATITVIGNTAVVTSSKKMEDFLTLQKYAPKALSLYESDESGKAQEVFRVGVAHCKPSMNEFGVSFDADNMTRGENPGFATFALEIPEYVAPERTKEYLSDAYGVSLMRLNAVEESMDGYLASVEEKKAAIAANITIQ